MRPVSRLIRWNLTSLAASQRRQEDSDLPPHSADTAPGTLGNNRQQRCKSMSYISTSNYLTARGCSMRTQKCWVMAKECM